MFLFHIYRLKLSIWSFGGLFLAASILLFEDGLAAKTVELELGQTLYSVEIASSSKQRRQGLMHRPHLSPRQGMLLLYPEVGDHRIWMKNMLIPLRVYWIDENYTVIGMQRVQPCNASPCPVYSIDRDSRYILELGDYEHPLEPGDRIESLRTL